MIPPSAAGREIAGEAAESKKPSQARSTNAHGNRRLQGQQHVRRLQGFGDGALMLGREPRISAQILPVSVTQR